LRHAAVTHQSQQVGYSLQYAGGVAAGVSSKDDIVLMMLRMRDEATKHTTATSTYYTLPGLRLQHSRQHSRQMQQHAMQQSWLNRQGSVMPQRMGSTPCLESCCHSGLRSQRLNLNLCQVVTALFCEDAAVGIYMCNWQWCC